MSVRFLLPLLCTLIATTTSAQTPWEWESVTRFTSWASFHDIAHLGGGVLIAIGLDNQIARSNDSGRNWEIQTVKGLDPLHLSFADSLHGIIALHDGGFLRTEDGGRSWQSIDNYFSRAYPVDVAYNRQGVILQVGRGGGLNRSADSGATWTYLPVDGASGIARALFVDDQVALLGTASEIYRSTDAGARWQRVIGDLDGPVTGLHFASSGYGIASTATQLFSSTDNGITWRDITPPGAGMRFGMVATVGPERLLVISPDSSSALTSSDAGATWERLVIDTADSRQIHNAVVLLDASTSLVVGWHAGIHRSGDGMRSWSQVVKSFSGAPRDIAFNGAGHGFIVCDGGAMYESSDRGRTWFSRRRVTDSTLRGISFRGKLGLAVGAGVILRSDDAGATWHRAIGLPSDIELAAVDIQSATFAIAVGERGAIARTTDGGKVWELLHLDPAPEQWEGERTLHDIAVLDRHRSIAVGHDRIMQSRDGGSSWSERRSSDTIFVTVEFADPLNGVIGAATPTFYGSIPYQLHTSNAGLTWRATPFPWEPTGGDDLDFIRDIHFIDPAHVIASGSRPIESFDGGRSWQTMEDMASLVRFDMLGDSVIIGINSSGMVERGTRLVPPGVTDTSGRRGDATTVALYASRPNPFLEGTVISFSLPSSGHAMLTIENIRGEHVATLVDGALDAGYYQEVWDAVDVPSGIYFMRIRQNGQAAVGRVVRR